MCVFDYLYVHKLQFVRPINLDVECLKMLKEKNTYTQNLWFNSYLCLIRLEPKFEGRDQVLFTPLLSFSCFLIRWQQTSKSSGFVQQLCYARGVLKPMPSGRRWRRLPMSEICRVSLSVLLTLRKWEALREHPLFAGGL